MKKILFVCHGNICRSVMAEFIMKKLVADANQMGEWRIDSCATSAEEIGNDIYPPAKKCLKAHNIPFEKHSARQITLNDFDFYDHIYCMENFNLQNLPTTNQKVQLLLPHDIADPWYTGDFEKTFQELMQGCKNLLNK